MIISYVQPPTATIEPPMAVAHEGEGSRVVKTISSDTPTTLAAVIKEALESSIRHIQRTRRNLQEKFPDLIK